MGQDETCLVNPKSYKVCVKKSITFKGVTSNVVIPREIKKNELCLIVRNRDRFDVVVLSLDEIHEVVIYPYSELDR